MAGYTLFDSPLSDLPDVEVDYYEEEDVLDVHTGDTKGVAATLCTASTAMIPYGPSGTGSDPRVN